MGTPSAPLLVLFAVSFAIAALEPFGSSSSELLLKLDQAPKLWLLTPADPQRSALKKSSRRLLSKKATKVAKSDDPKGSVHLRPIKEFINASCINVPTFYSKKRNIIIERII